MIMIACGLPTKSVSCMCLLQAVLSKANPRMPAQLNTSMASGRSFAGYIEAPIVFRPTYKSVPVHVGQSLQILTLTLVSRIGTTTVRMITILPTRCASLRTRIGSFTRAKEYAARSLALRLSCPADRMSSSSSSIAIATNEPSCEPPTTDQASRLPCALIS